MVKKFSFPAPLSRHVVKLEKSGAMLEKDYIGEEFEIYEMPISEFMANAKKVEKGEK